MSSAVSAPFYVRTSGRGEFIDITDAFAEAVVHSCLSDGAAFAFCAHTTCSLLINEWEEGAHYDLRGSMDVLFPPSAYYRHDDLAIRTQNLQEDEPRNGHSHVAQALVGAPSQMVPVVGGEIALGRWQRLVLLELDRSRDRQVIFTVVGNAPVMPPEPDKGMRSSVELHSPARLR